MADINFIDFIWNGLLLRSERSYDKLIKWIHKNRSILETGSYEIVYAGIKICNVYKEDDGSIHF